MRQPNVYFNIRRWPVTLLNFVFRSYASLVIRRRTVCVSPFSLSNSRHFAVYNNTTISNSLAQIQDVLHVIDSPFAIHNPRRGAKRANAKGPST